MLTTYFAVPYRRPRRNRFGKPIGARSRVIDRQGPAVALINKAASTSIASAIMGFEEGTRVDLATARAHHPTRLMFIRHPLERLKSCFSMFWQIAMRGESPDDVPVDVLFRPNRSVQGDWRSFVDYVVGGAQNRHFLPQVPLFTDAQGFVPTIVHRLEDARSLRPGTQKTQWEHYYEGYLPVTNAMTRKRVADYRLADLQSYYAADLQTWSAVGAAGGTWTAP